ncbi:MAG: PA0069 family radical SAM protein [Candidatus Methylacidiphilales bacterium]|nr:PA0069 family radical SAM protein [Candidatus Methylacidiphilales bacterium]
MNASAPDSPRAAKPHARGAPSNPAGRFESIQYDHTALDDPPLHSDEWPMEPGAGTDPDNPDHAVADDCSKPALKTRFYRDLSNTIINYNDSPDIGFRASLNAYRGCEHGCAYCYARPTHEYLGWSAGLDFESKILVKERAPELLREALNAPKWEPQVIAMSGVTDCYQPAERHFQLTRRCLEVLGEFRNPVGIVTKNHLVTRDIDLLSELASHRAVVVYVSITTLDARLARSMEPRTSSPAHRLDAVRRLTEAGIPVGVMMAPIIPGLTDHEILPLLQAAKDAGAQAAGYTALRLPYGVKDIFVEWLEKHFPEKRDRVVSRILELRGGKLNQHDWATRMKGSGLWAEQIRHIFDVAKRRAGIGTHANLSSASFRRRPNQMELWPM